LSFGRRLILKPGERRTIRNVAINERSPTDRVCRSAITPVAGTVAAESSAPKVFVGYDALVIVRPDQPAGDVRGRADRPDPAPGQDRDNRPALPAKRLYGGATSEQALPFETEISHNSVGGSTSRERRSRRF